MIDTLSSSWTTWSMPTVCPGTLALFPQTMAYLKLVRKERWISSQTSPMVLPLLTISGTSRSASWPCGFRYMRIMSMVSYSPCFSSSIPMPVAADTGKQRYSEFLSRAASSWPSLAMSTLLTAMMALMYTLLPASTSSICSTSMSSRTTTVAFTWP